MSHIALARHPPHSFSETCERKNDDSRTECLSVIYDGHLKLGRSPRRQGGFLQVWPEGMMEMLKNLSKMRWLTIQLTFQIYDEFYNEL